MSQGLHISHAAQWNLRLPFWECRPSWPDSTDSNRLHQPGLCFRRSGRCIQLSCFGTPGGFDNCKYLVTIYGFIVRRIVRVQVRHGVARANRHATSGLDPDRVGVYTVSPVANAPDCGSAHT